MRSVCSLLLLFLSFSLSSQDHHQHDNRCGYEEWLEEYEALNPGYTEMIKKGLKDFGNKKLSEKRSSALVVIPVHVILVHPPGQAEGTGVNFTLEHVQSQIDVLNQDFGFYNSDAGNTPDQFPAGDTGIQFCLATVDPNGAPTDGITRYGTNTSMANNAGRTEVIAATKWPRENYMNIWSAPNLPFLGLATVPGTGGLPNSNQDFILVASTTFGGPGYGSNAPYNLGRTTTHEVGHWLGLFHIWGNDGCGNDDGISDTPVQDDENFGCPSHPSPSCGNSGDMFMNYMDYVNDACMFAFSLGQGQYMNTILSTSRASLQGSAATACAFVVPLTLTVLDQQDPNCSDINDGYILVEADGGTPGYTYAIDGGAPTNDGLFTDLPGGTYNIEVFDADGTTTSVTVFLNTPLPLIGNAEITATNPCPNESIAEITIDVSGGTNPYFFSLNMGANQQTPIFDELPNGFYTFQITDNNGCTFEDVIEIAGSNDIDITIDTTINTTCFEGSDGIIELSATGGNGPLSYALEDGDTQEEGIFEGLINGDYLIFVSDSLGCFDSVLIAIEQPLEIDIQTVVSDVICYNSNNGELSITASGGNGNPYIYNVNGNDIDGGSITDLDIGEYMIIASDSLGCIGFDTVTIIQPDSLVAEVIKEDVSCYGVDNGAVEIQAIGGTSGYQYILETDTISDGIFTELTEGNYLVEVIDANGCNIQVMFEIDYVPVIQTDATIANVTCYGLANGSLTLNATNTSGTPMYSINEGPEQTNNTFLNLAPGDYSVIISDDTGCDAIAFATITEPVELFIETEIASDVSCKGGSDGQVIFNAIGGTPPYSFQIEGDNSDQNELPAGDYNVSVTDNLGCTTESQFTIGEPELFLEVSYEVNGSEVALDVIGGTEPYLYSFNEGDYSNSNITAASSDPIIASVQDANGCVSTITILQSNTNDLASEWEINAYPIPFKDILNIDLNFNKSLDASVQIFDINSRLVHKISNKIYQSGENSVKIDVSNFASSIYIVKIASAEGYRYIKVTKM